MIKSLTVTLEDSVDTALEKAEKIYRHRKNLTKAEAMEYLETAKANIEQIDSSLESGYFRGQDSMDLKYAKHHFIEGVMSLEDYIEKL